MRLLLDTQVVLWQLSGERKLPENARRVIERADDLLFSVVSFAEIGIKVAAGKLDVSEDLPERVADAGIRTLGLTARHGLATATLPVHHKDPFDRLIIAQAATEELAVVTSDRRFADYPITVIDAS